MKNNSTEKYEEPEVNEPEAQLTARTKRRVINDSDMFECQSDGGLIDNSCGMMAFTLSCCLIADTGIEFTQEQAGALIPEGVVAIDMALYLDILYRAKNWEESK